MKVPFSDVYMASVDDKPYNSSTYTYLPSRKPSEKEKFPQWNTRDVELNKIIGKFLKSSANAFENGM